jgi:hypothetical protein
LAQQNSHKTKMHFDKHTSMHSFKIGDKVLIANDFKTTKNPKLVPKWKGPAEIIDLNDITQKCKSAKM